MKNYPLLTKSFIEHFIAQDLSDKVLLEFGSGKSTIFWSSYFDKIYSYESNINWFNEIKKHLNKNVELVLVNDKDILQNMELVIHVKNSDYIIIDNDSKPISRFEYARFVLHHKKEDSQIILDNGTWQLSAYKFLQDNFFCRDFPGTNTEDQDTVTTLFFERKTKKYDYKEHLKKMGL